MNDVIKEFAKLPPWIEYQGITFELQLIVNGREDDVRLVYAIQNVSEESKHYQEWISFGSWENYFTESFCGFLYLEEKIASSEDLHEAIERTREFLSKNNLNEK